MTHRKLRSIRLAAAAAVLSASSAFAQQAARGLDAVDEHAVYSLLVNAKVDSLLDYDLEKNGVPPVEREQIRAVAALDTLVESPGLRATDRRRLAKQAAVGLAAQLSKDNNPDSILLNANKLTRAGILQQVTDMEYFGESPGVQTDLRPVVETARKLYDKYVQLLNNDITKINGDFAARRIKADVFGKKLDEVDNKQTAAKYFRSRIGYALAMSLPAKSPERLKTADETIAELSKYDNPDSTIQPAMRVMIGKLNIVKGDYDSAIKAFDVVINKPGDLKPAPSEFDQNDARYFMIVAELMSNNVTKASADVDSLGQWEQTNLRLKEAEQANVAASLEMLKFRILSRRADIANAKTDQEKLNNQAIETLTALLRSQPNNLGLQDLIYDQIRGRIKPGTPLEKMDALALLAVQKQGIEEYVDVVETKKKPQADEKAVSAAIEASKELVRRKGKAGVDEKTAATSQQFIALALDRLLHKPGEAGMAYLDYAAGNPSDKNARSMLDAATQILFELQDKKNDPDAVVAYNALFDKLMPVAIGPPFNNKLLAYPYGKQLLEVKKYQKAYEMLDMVPADAKNRSIADLYELQAITEWLGGSPKDPAGDARIAVAKRGIALAESVRARSVTDAAAAKDATEKTAATLRQVFAMQTASELARSELKDPTASLKALDGIEKVAAGLPAERVKAVGLSASRMRVNNYLDLGKVDEAFNTLVELLKVDPTAGQEMLQQVSQTVGDDLNKAIATDNKPAIQKLSATQAVLSGYLVQWAEKSDNAEVKARLPEIRRYDAQNKQEAAALMTDPAQRKTNLEAALKQYQALLATDKNDKVSQLGAGLILFDLGDYEKSLSYLLPLNAANNFGSAEMDAESGNGTHKMIENARYWEAKYKIAKASFELYKAHPKDPKSAEYLKGANAIVTNLSVLYTKTFGGSRYGEQFKKLQSDLAATK